MSAELSIERKMSEAAQSDAAIRAFLGNYRQLAAGETGLLAEDALVPATDLPDLHQLPPGGDDRLLDQTVVIKLNGGLGTGMGLDRAKTLLPIKDGLNFLDLIARQILHLRGRRTLRFLLMNSFSTSDDTMKHLARYPALGSRDELEFIQSQVPKIDVATMFPAESPADPALAWCPPGHGDLYASLSGSGCLQRLLNEGIRYAFISNADNLGATPDLRILQHFAALGSSFLMEVTRRTAADRKGGHLALRRTGQRLVLRESAQCPAADQPAFQDIGKHRYFNTNNLWVRLDRLHKVLRDNDGVFPLPIIRNEKTVDPKDSQSAKVYQLETAMGAAIEAFADAAALEVPRSRFAPVKKTSDLMVLRSDACAVRADWTLGLVPERKEIPPTVELSDIYKLIDDYDALVLQTPSLIAADRLEVRGKVCFPEPVTISGRVKIDGNGDLPGGAYRDRDFSL